MKLENIDYTLYLVTDWGLSRGRSSLEIVEAAVRGGVTCVQLREKECSILQFIKQALAIKERLKALNIPLIINDRLDIALAVRADGVHQGQSDMPLKMAREIVKNNCEEVTRRRADGIAVVSAIVSAEDPETAAAELSII